MDFAVRSTKKGKTKFHMSYLDFAWQGGRVVCFNKVLIKDCKAKALPYEKLLFLKFLMWVLRTAKFTNGTSYYAKLLTAYLVCSPQERRSAKLN